MAKSKPKHPKKTTPLKPQVTTDTRNRKYQLGLAAILVLTLIVYLNSLTNGFITNWDDNRYILQNPYLKEFSWKTISTIFSSFYNLEYYPLTILTYLFEYQLWGLNAGPYHAFNLFIHLVNTILVFYLIRLIFQKKWLALLSALFFAIHPMHVESVSWISERKDVLYALFYLSSLITYVLYIRSNYKIRYLVYGIVLFILSLFSKSMAVTLPVILVGIDLFVNRKIHLRSIIEKIPFFILSLLFGILTLKSQTHSGPYVDILFTIPQRFFIVCYSIMLYVYKLILPFDLSAIYYYPIRHHQVDLNIGYYLAPFGVAILLTLPFLLKKIKRELLAGLIFFIIILLPVLQLVPVGQAIIAERYTYLSYLGLFIIVLFIAEYLLSNISSLKLRKQGTYFILIMFTLFFAYRVVDRNKDWQNGIVLFDDVIKRYPHIFYSYYVRGTAKQLENDTQGALADFNKCIELSPTFAHGYSARGQLFYNIKRCHDAVSDYTQYIRLMPRSDEGYVNRSVAYICVENYHAAIQDCDSAIAINPQNAKAFLNRGSAKGIIKDYEGSIRDLTKAIEQSPQNGIAYNNRAITYSMAGKMNEACRDWKISLQLGHISANQFITKYCK